MIDLGPSAERMTRLLASVAEEQFAAPTPCAATPVGDLVDHVGSFALAFTAAARKKGGDLGGPPPPPSTANLEEGWRERIRRDLATLADAWRQPDAWEGLTSVGGVDLPGEVAGLAALDELVVHGWDIAVASGQAYEPRLEDVEAAMSFVASFDGPRDGSLFGPVVPVAGTADPLDRLLGLTGRDPGWRP
ncbi:MAG TPA: TIGR03086 family metal-binding protein [Acidimicrobiales bacterium]